VCDGVGGLKRSGRRRQPLRDAARAARLAAWIGAAGVGLCDQRPYRFVPAHAQANNASDQTARTNRRLIIPSFDHAEFSWIV
jgi:hypothetical protein